MKSRNVLGQEYQPRIVDSALEQDMQAAGAVVLEGARATGKTMTALRAAASYIFVDAAETHSILQIAPETILDGPAPRLIDEWQVAPELWNLVRRAVDAEPKPGRFILTGSAVPVDDATRHTGAGRFLHIRQRTMTWSEKLDAEKDRDRVSVGALFDGDRPVASLAGPLTLDDVIHNLLTPGFPAMRTLRPAQSASRLRGYIDDIARADVPRLTQIRQKPDVVTRLITAVARSVASEVTYRALAADVRAVAPTVDADTISDYLGLLRRLFVVEEQHAWTPALRSRARLRSSSKLHLVDPALAASALGAGPGHLKSDLMTLGMLFESAVIHDLTVIATALDGEVRHYRDSNGKEIDAVITLPDGRWGAVEVKLGAGQVAAGTESLRKAIADIDTSAVGEPSFRLVVTGMGPRLTAADGTVVCPLADLVP